MVDNKLGKRGFGANMVIDIVGGAAVATVIGLCLSRTIDANLGVLLVVAILLCVWIRQSLSPQQARQFSLRELLLITLAVAAYFAGRATVRDEAARQPSHMESLEARLFAARYNWLCRDVKDNLRSLSELDAVLGAYYPTSNETDEDELIASWDFGLVRDHDLARIQQLIGKCVRPLKALERNGDWAVTHRLEIQQHVTSSNPMVPTTGKVTVTARRRAHSSP